LSYSGVIDRVVAVIPSRSCRLIAHRHTMAIWGMGVAGNSSRLRFCPVAYHNTTYKRSPSTTVQIVSF